jgi:hypothetical protein
LRTETLYIPVPLRQKVSVSVRLHDTGPCLYSNFILYGTRAELCVLGR